MLVQPDALAAPSAPQCAVPPSNSNSNTVTLALSSDGGCCNVVETITLGHANECHTANAGFSSLVQAVGSNMFGRGIQIEIFTDTSCRYGGHVVDLSNRHVCDTGGSTTFHSFKLSQSTPSSGSSSGGSSSPPPDGYTGGQPSRPPPSGPDYYGCVVAHS